MSLEYEPMRAGRRRREELGTGAEGGRSNRYEANWRDRPRPSSGANDTPSLPVEQAAELGQQFAQDPARNNRHNGRSSRDGVANEAARRYFQLTLPLKATWLMVFSVPYLPTP